MQKKLKRRKYKPHLPGREDEYALTEQRLARALLTIQAAQPANGTPDRAEVALANQTGSNTRKRQRTSTQYNSDGLTDDDVTDLVRSFRTAKYPIQARTDHANERHEVEAPGGKTAYAKIAGNGWTYYVTEVELRIGRPPEERMPNEAAGTGYGGEDGIDDKAMVHIDLGPSKLVSRHHAEIRYEDGPWTISVNGRNGIKLDEESLTRGARRNLISGSVIEIAGTQMLFVTPGKAPIVHPKVIADLRAHESDEDDVDGFKAPPRPPQRTPGRGLSSGSAHQHSSSRGFNGAGQYGRQHRGSALGQHHGSADMPTSGALQSPAYPRGIILDSMEDIDYSRDDVKDVKPPHSYAQLIGMAILNNDEEKLTLSRIYDFIRANFAFYRLNGGGWQVSNAVVAITKVTMLMLRRIRSVTTCRSTNASRKWLAEQTSQVKA